MPYNPTGNLIVERANKGIGLVLRLSKNDTVIQLEKNIWTCPNCTYNKTIGKCPNEIFKQESILKNMKKNCIVDLQNVSERMNKLAASTMINLERRNPILKSTTWY